MNHRLHKLEKTPAKLGKETEWGVVELRLKKGGPASSRCSFFVRLVNYLGLARSPFSQTLHASELRSPLACLHTMYRVPKILLLRLLVCHRLRNSEALMFQLTKVSA